MYFSRLIGKSVNSHIVLEEFKTPARLGTRMCREVDTDIILTCGAASSTVPGDLPRQPGVNLFIDRLTHGGGGRLRYCRQALLSVRRLTGTHLATGLQVDGGIEGRHFGPRQRP